MEWVVATRSRGKLAEFAPLLAAYGVRARSLDEIGAPEREEEAAIEIFDTLAANAAAKASYFAALTGLPCLADDSGLTVGVLQGAPGVRSRRYARDLGISIAGLSEDAANIAAVLAACAATGVAAPWPAAFECALALSVNGAMHHAAGRTTGVLEITRSGTGGFGYDPIFRSDDLQVTFAEASSEAKARVSHRARALQALLARPDVRVLLSRPVDEIA
jgi:XTP/dITP diphosphohydrolase